MNDFDKNEYYDNIIKSMTRLCHDKCFKGSSLSEDCISICYHKYINTISKIEQLSINLGKEARSEFVTRVYKTKEDPLEDEYLFPKGGKMIWHISRRFKYFESNFRPLYKGGLNPYKDISDQQ
jgi:hypothetical protein